MLGIWSFFGNHCDGSCNMFAVAQARVIKSTHEEFAKKCIPQHSIFDVDIHYVPPHTRKGEVVPEHLHYDIAYLFFAPYDATLNGAQNKWFPLKEAAEVLAFDTQHKRIWEKLTKLAPTSTHKFLGRGLRVMPPRKRHQSATKAPR